MKIVWFSEIQWNYLKTRKQQIIGHFPPEWEVLFIEPYVAGRPFSFTPKKSGQVTFVTVPYFKSVPQRWINTLQNFILFRVLYQILIYLWILWLLRRTGFHKTERIICVSNVLYIPIIRRLKRRLLIYDCNDIPMGFSSSLHFLTPRFAETVRLSDGIITVSRKLAEKIRSYQNREIKVIGNGVDVDVFLRTYPEPSDMKTLPSPRLFYAGAISDWFDVNLLFKIACTYKNTAIILIGPFLSASVKEKILTSGISNIYWLREKKYTELPAYYQASDVCLIPFIQNELTSGLNPNKLYEYLASGKPVVTKNYSEEIQQLSGQIYVANNDDQFLENIRKALHNPPHPESLRELAKQHCWTIKSRDFAEYILHLLQPDVHTESQK